MNRISTIINVVLIIAVGVLYYMRFSVSKEQKIANIVSAIKRDTTLTRSPLIGYVDLDTLNAKVTFIKQRKTELEQEQKGIAAEYENSYRSLEAEKNNFLKKGNAITQQEAQVFQEHLMQQQQQVESTKQLKGQKLAEKGAKIMDDMQAKLKQFLNEYNSDKRFTYILATGTGLDYVFYKDSTLNITDDIVKGLNEKMK